jgi:glutamate 5-kinase
MITREQLKKTQRWVIKIGSALLTNEGQGLYHEGIKKWVAQMAALRQSGIEVVLVSSGSVAEGMSRLGWKSRPHELHKLQAAAAVGQMGLVQAYESYFLEHGLHTAQILLTHDDLSNRGRYLNARSTLQTLIGYGVIPVINENDTVVTDEIRFGDNDTLGALTANLVEADLLVILTDQQGMFDKDPRTNSDARLLSEVEANDKSLDSMASDSGGSLGRGGMATKVRAARLAARSGSATVIAAGREENVLNRVLDGEEIGTLFLPDKEPLLARKQWLAGHFQVRGVLTLDDGAVKVLQAAGRSLLPVGVTGVKGKFSRGEMVSCADSRGNEIARGLANYNSYETSKIMGHSSRELESILGYVDEPELIHRDNLILIR